jgi:hypothetical protein
MLQCVIFKSIDDIGCLLKGRRQVVIKAVVNDLSSASDNKFRYVLKKEKEESGKVIF